MQHNSIPPRLGGAAAGNGPVRLPQAGCRRYVAVTHRPEPNFDVVVRFDAKLVRFEQIENNVVRV